MAKKLATVVAGILLLASPLHAEQQIKLVCSGTMFQYDPDRVEGTVGPAAAKIDFGAALISTPVGRFHIKNVSDTEIVFDDPNSSFKVFGHLDRLTGEMTVFWRRPEEEQKLQHGLPARMSRYSELQCAPAKPLF